jgi:hypothetical protein
MLQSKVGSAPLGWRSPKTRAEVWGPHYWFFLHSVARTYPEPPNEVTKRKYYDLIMNFPFFIPDTEIAMHFSDMLERFPVTPYLTSRQSFIRWMYFMHNKINHYLEKYEPTFEEAMQSYDDKFRAPEIVVVEKWRLNKHHIFIGALIVGIFIAVLGGRRK